MPRAWRPTPTGGYQAGMGVACGDLDGDGRARPGRHEFLRRVDHASFTTWVRACSPITPPRSAWRRRAATFSGFGAAFLDANNDGRLDLMTANGHVSDMRPVLPFAMTAQLFLAGQGGRLTDVTAQAGPPFQRLLVGRGLAVGDLDNDGRLDAVMVAQNEPLVYFHNQTKRTGEHFAMFQLQGTKSNRDGVGAARVAHGWRTKADQAAAGRRELSVGRRSQAPFRPRLERPSRRGRGALAVGTGGSIPGDRGRRQGLPIG